MKVVCLRLPREMLRHLDVLSRRHNKSLVQLFGWALENFTTLVECCQEYQNEVVLESGEETLYIANFIVNAGPETKHPRRFSSAWFRQKLDRISKWGGSLGIFGARMVTFQLDDVAERAIDELRALCEDPNREIFIKALALLDIFSEEYVEHPHAEIVCGQNSERIPLSDFFSDEKGGETD
jgi:hypothetical protein